jgi:hypothetical protein
MMSVPSEIHLLYIESSFPDVFAKNEINDYFSLHQEKISFIIRKSVVTPLRQVSGSCPDN